MRMWLVSLMVLAATAQSAARPGWLGLGLTHHVQEGEQWLVVRAVAPGGPAAKAGLQEGDVISAIDGKPILFKTTFAFLESLATIKPGERVKFQVVRRGRRVTSVVRAAVMNDAQYERWKTILELERRDAQR